MSGKHYWTEILAARSTRRRAITASAPTAGGSLFLVACGGSDSPGAVKNGATSKPVDTTKAAVRGGVFKTYRTADFPPFDPNVATPALSFWGSLALSRLTRPEPGYLEDPSGNFVGDLAESWE